MYFRKLSRMFGKETSLEVADNTLIKQCKPFQFFFNFFFKRPLTCLCFCPGLTMTFLDSAHRKRRSCTASDETPHPD